jgi:hypothetical protein
MKNKRYAYDDGEDVQADPLLSVALAKSQSLIESGVWNMMSPDQERLVAPLSEVNMLKDRKVYLSKDTQGVRKGNKPEDKGKLKRHPSPARKSLTRKSGHGRKSLPRLGSPKPNACLGLTIITTGVMIIKHGLYTSQKIMNSDRAIRRTTVHPQPIVRGGGVIKANFA